MKILFVTATSHNLRPYGDVSARYRAYNPACALAQLGHTTLIVSARELTASLPILDRFDAVVYHRPHFNIELVPALHRFSSTRVVAADFDDLLFVPQYATYAPDVRKDISNMPAILNSFMSINAAAGIFSRYSLSTEPLKTEVAKTFPGSAAAVIHNALPLHEQGHATMHRQLNPWRERKFLFGYFPGTPTHARDFSTIAEPVVERLNRGGAAMLWVGPEADAIPALKKCKNIVTLPAQPYQKFIKLVAQCKYTLAPLEPTPFNNAKSCIKFMESALCGSITLGTPIPDIDRFSSDMLIKCKNPEEWEKSLINLREDPPDIEKCLASLLPSFDPHTQARRLEELLAQ